MEPARFDRLTRALAGSIDRRGALFGLLGGVLAPFAPVLPDDEVDAKDRRRTHPSPPTKNPNRDRQPEQARDDGPDAARCVANGQRCGKSSGKKGKPDVPCAKCCSKYGTPKSQGPQRCSCRPAKSACTNDAQCCGGQCPGGRCGPCRTGLIACAGGCVDPGTDRDHCGGCGAACDSGRVCQNGACRCTPGSCADGCCEGNQCNPGTGDAACGSGGGACGVCAAGQSCTGQTCTCGGAGCAGCCDGSTCRTGDTNSTCGRNGAVCQTCTGAAPCYRGECCSPDPDAVTCAGKCGSILNNCGQDINCTPFCAGCCDGGTCNAGTSDGACGVGGTACAACADGQDCAAGQCTCNGASCSGCCDGVACRDGDTDAFCGVNGGICTQCSGVDTCGGGNPGSPGICSCTANPDSTTCVGKCGTVQNNCGQNVNCTQICAGCCDGGTCRAGTAVGNCGRNGAACQACTGTGVTCGGGGTPGVCGCAPNPDAATCAGKCGSVQNNCGQNVNCTPLCGGCCDGAVCRTGDTNANCGTGGGACQTCAGTGVTCGGGGTRGVCGCTPASDATTCAGRCGTIQNNCGQSVNCTALCTGCCAGATCQAGDTVANCGTGGAACAACTGDEECGGGTCAVPPACGAPGGPCRVFVTSQGYNGNLGGLAGADAKCQAAAAAANLNGSYRAWLSTGASSPATDATFTRARGPYRRVDGVRIAADWADLTDGALAARIDVTESGNDRGAAFAWTHTRTDGTTGGVFNLDCGGWTSTATDANGDIGFDRQTNGAWTVATGANCSTALSLYCFQQS